MFIIFVLQFWAAVLLARNVQPDPPPPDVPRFWFEALSFQSDQPGTSRLDVYIEVPYTQLRFKHENNVFRAECEATLSVFDSTGALITEKWLNEKIETTEYKTTISPHEAKLIQRSIQLPPGRYDVSVLFLDTETKKTGKVRRKVVVKGYAPMTLSMSDIMLVNQLFSDAEKKMVSPNISGNVATGSAGFFIFFEVYNPFQIDSARVFIDVVNDKYVIVQRDTFWQPLVLTKRSCFRKIETISLRSGDFTLRARIESSGDPSAIEVVAQHSFSVRWEGMPSTILDLDKSIDQMQYILEKDHLDEMKDAPENLKRELFQQFWKQKDPTRGTERNELMEEYFGRVAYANKSFSHYIEGWRSDMGMVYIIFGSPSNVERHPFDIGEKPYEIWTYYQQNREFVFFDQSGFGDYRLQTPIWDVQRTRPR